LSEDAQAAKAAKQRRLAEALRANLRRRKAAGRTIDQPGLATTQPELAATTEAAGTEDEG
jgi:hypothetical protein